MRTIRAFISNDFRFASGGLDVQVGLQELNDQGLPVRTDAVLTFQGPDGQPVEASWKWHYISEHERGILMNGASLRLEEGVGQALLEALARHYHGTSDTHRMANDLGRERQRRDMAEDRLWEILSSMSSTQSVSAGHVQDILFQMVKNAGSSDESAIRMVDLLNTMAQGQNQTVTTEQPGLPLRFHESPEFGRCRGHMPWDLGEECRA